MNDMDQNLKGTALPSVYRAADGSGAGAPRDGDPRRSAIELGDMLEMGLESLLMHFRRQPDAKISADRTTTPPDDQRPED
jgi:hypothetical protein